MATMISPGFILLDWSDELNKYSPARVRIAPNHVAFPVLLPRKIPKMGVKTT